MTVKIKTAELVKLHADLRAVFNEPVEYEFADLLSGMIESIGKALDTQARAKAEVAQAFDLKNPKDLVMRDPVKREKYNAAVDLINAREIELPFDPIQLATLKRFKISPLGLLTIRKAGLVSDGDQS